MDLLIKTLYLFGENPFSFMKNSTLFSGIFLFPLFFVLFACDTHTSENSHSHPTEATTQIAPKEKALLIIAEDRSGSTQGQRKLTAEQYREIFEAFAGKYCGEIDVRIIGNPSPQDRNFFPLVIECPQPTKNIPPKALLTEKAAIAKENKKIQEQNKLLEKKNKRKINAFVEKIVKQKIIRYRPHQDVDVTDIADFFSHLEKKLKEPTYRDYDKIFVVIISDGKHNASRLSQPLHFQSPVDALIYVIGWEDMSVFGNQDVEEFESVDGFLHYFKHAD